MRCKLTTNALTINPNGDILLCCWAPTTILGNIAELTNERDFQNSNILVSIKDSLNVNKWPAECNACQIKEESNCVSKRMHMEKRLPVESRKIQLLDIAFSNKCNLKCIMCDGTFSSKHKGKITTWDLDKLFDVFDLSELCKVDIKGGEPFIQKELPKFLEKIKKDIDLRIFSNGLYNNTILEECLELLKKFKSFTPYVSMDGTSEYNSQIRGIKNINKIVLYCEQILKLSNIKSPRIIFTVNNINYVNIPDFINFVDMHPTLNQMKIEFSFLHQPAHLSIFNIPNIVKMDLSSINQNLILNFNDLNNIIGSG